MELKLIFFCLQIVAHLSADFFFQTYELAREKNEKGFKTWYLVVHGLIVLLTSYILSFEIKFILGSLIISVSHYLIDGIKSLIINKIENDPSNQDLKITNYSKYKLLFYSFLRKYIFYLDQLIHLVIIYTVIELYFQYVFNSPSYGLKIAKLIPYYKEVIFATGIILCLKPSNILIGQILKTFNINIEGDNKNADELKNAGKLIGVIERILTIIFIIFQQFGAVGFLLAAKSILRYKEADTKKTEYVLIGTMLSFAISIIIGLLIIKLK